MCHVCGSHDDGDGDVTRPAADSQASAISITVKPSLTKGAFAALSKVAGTHLSAILHQVDFALVMHGSLTAISRRYRSGIVQSSGTTRVVCVALRFKKRNKFGRKKQRPRGLALFSKQISVRMGCRIVRPSFSRAHHRDSPDIPSELWVYCCESCGTGKIDS